MRIRSWVVAAPIVTSLGLLLGAGLLDSEPIDPGPGPAFYRWLTLLSGSAATVVICVAAGRSTGRLRTSWAAIAVTTTLDTLSLLCVLDDAPVLAWVVLRPAACLAGAAALLTAPGVRRTVRAWGLVLLDGWLVGGSVFVIGWLALDLTGSRWTPGSILDRPSLLWVPVDLLFVSVVVGLAGRSDRAVRIPVLMMVLASLLRLTGDCTLALADGPAFAVVQGAIMMACFAASTVSHRLDLWQTAGPDDARPSLVRWSQVAVVPGLAAAVSRPAAGPVTAVAISVIVAMVAEILLVSHQNVRLWEALSTQAARLDLLVRSGRDAIVQVDEHGTVEFANDAVGDVLGCLPSALLGRRFTTLLPDPDRAGFADQIAQLGLPPAPVSVRVSTRVRHPDGAVHHIEATVSRHLAPPDGAGYTLLARDVTDRIRREAELRQLASSDALTGLLNRHAFLQLLGERLAAGPVAVLFLDLDGFKTVNDLHGHAVGDRLLIEAAQALQAVLGVGDVAARLGGDEFAVLACRPARAQARALAVRITHRLRRLPSDLAGTTGASIGVAVGQGVGAEQLLADADLAMYRAKGDGGGRVVVYSPDLRTEATAPA